MIVIRSNSQILHTFYDVRPGSVFEFETNYYMKLDQTHNSAVCLKNGIFRVFSTGTKVEVINGAFKEE